MVNRNRFWIAFQKFIYLHLSLTLKSYYFLNFILLGLENKEMRQKFVVAAQGFYF